MSEPRPTHVVKIPTEPSMGRALIEHDPESRSYPVRGTLIQSGVTRRTKTWRRAHRAYDQGSSSSCVGQTFRGMINTGPNTAQLPQTTRSKYTALRIYKNAQLNDEWPGQEPTYYGTSALGALKYLRAEGVVKEYRWCFGVDDVLDTLSQYGPVALGVWWYDGMMGTDAKGYIRPSGRQVGGHEVELHGINVSGKYVIGTNSWGTSWGYDNGRFKLSWNDLDTLLEDYGDAATIVDC